MVTGTQGMQDLGTHSPAVDNVGETVQQLINKGKQPEPVIIEGEAEALPEATPEWLT